MIEFSPLLPIWLIILMLGLATALFAWFSRKNGALLAPKGRRAVRLLRLGIFAVFAIFLLNPAWVDQKPDPDQSRIILLSDVSASMETRDCDGHSRLHALNAALPKISSKIGVISADFGPFDSPLQLADHFSFSNDPRRVQVLPLETRPGKTAPAKVLQELIPETDWEKIGAVIMLTDGCDLGTPNLLEFTRQRQAALPPLSFVGFGELNPPLDLKISTEKQNIKTLQGQDTTVNLSVDSNLAQPFEAVIELFNETRKIAEYPVKSTKSSATVEVTLPAQRSGAQLFRAQLKPPRPDSNPANDTALINLEVKPPEKFRLLFLSHQPDWLSRFAAIYCQNNPQLSFSGLIQTTADQLISIGTLPDYLKKAPTFPTSSADLRGFDAILLPASFLAKTSPELTQALQQFVAERGGGLLVYGTELPKQHPILVELPGVLAPAAFPPQDLPIAVKDQEVLPPAISSILRQPDLILPKHFHYAPLTELKPGARAIIVHNEQTLAAVQQYGSGRTALLGTPSLWRWQLSNNSVGPVRFETLFSQLFRWLTSGNKPQITANINGKTVSSDQPFELKVRAFNHDFTYCRQPTIQALLHRPDGTIEEINLQQQSIPGRYVQSLNLGQEGLHKLTLSFKDDHEVETVAHFHFLSRSHSPELVETSFKGHYLREIARRTGGSYHHWRDLDDIDQWPLSDALPKIESRTELNRQWPFLLLMALLFISEWYIRRRGGLV